MQPVTGSRPSQREASRSTHEEDVKESGQTTEEDEEAERGRADYGEEAPDIEECLIRKIWGYAPCDYSRMDEADEGDATDALQREKDELFCMLRKLSVLGFLQFPGMVLFFFIAVSGKQILAWSILAVKLMAGYWWQRGQLLVLHDLLRGNKTDRGRELYKVCTKFITKGWQPCGDFFTFPSRVRHWRTVLMLCLYEVIDPDWDAMTAGNAESLINEEQGERFAESWRHSVPFVPGFGDLVAWIGLPNLLQGSIIFAAIIQIGTLAKMACMCRDSINQLEVDKTRYFVFADFAHVADLSNMMLISDAFLDLRQAQLKPKDEQTGRPKDRIHGFMAKIVCETVPAAWLQVSLLALAKPTSENPQAVISTILSVLSSLYAMFKALLLAIPHLAYQVRQISDKGCHQMLALNALCVPLTVLMLLACTIRFAGVFLCPSSMLNLTSGCVPPE